MALASSAIAIVALVKANQVSNQQAEAAAPVLAAGTPLAQRGKEMSVFTTFGFAKKRADRMWLDRSKKARLIIPLVNGGAGIALTIGEPVIVSNCAREPSILPPEKAIMPPVGTYVIPSGGADQLGFVSADSQRHYLDRRLWYSFDYRHLGLSGTNLNAPASSTNVLIFYTDSAQRKLRWTCITYLPTPDKWGDEWAYNGQVFGTRPMVSGLQVRTH
jgi:hypothetical protein